MSQANKRKGTQAEVEVVNFGKEELLDIERVARAGSKDQGDFRIRLKSGVDVVGEVKNVRSAWSQMAEFLRQSLVEADHSQEATGRPSIGVVCTKTRGKGPAKMRIVCEFDTFIDFLRLMDQA